MLYAKLIMQGLHNQTLVQFITSKSKQSVVKSGTIIFNRINKGQD